MLTIQFSHIVIYSCPCFHSSCWVTHPRDNLKLGYLRLDNWTVESSALKEYTHACTCTPNTSIL